MSHINKHPHKFVRPILPPPHEEEQYLDLVRQIIQRGEYEKCRNGCAFSVFGYSMRFSLRDGTLPLLTTKKLAWKTCFKELMWFIRGQTDAAILQKQDVHIWDGNSTREFLDGRGLHDRAEGDLGPIYSHQWRHFNAPYVDCHTDYSGQGVDQLGEIIRALKSDRLEDKTSRRLIVSAWNPCQLAEMALPPCHVIMQFHVDATGRKLSCAMFQRSGDVGLGVPFNIASYAFLTHILAHHCGLEPWEFVYFLGNAHIYEPHFDAMQEQMRRKPHPFPRIRFTKTHEQIEEYDLADIEFLREYTYEPPIKMEMVA